MIKPDMRRTATKLMVRSVMECQDSTVAGAGSYHGLRRAPFRSMPASIISSASGRS